MGLTFSSARVRSALSASPGSRRPSRRCGRPRALDDGLEHAMSDNTPHLRAVTAQSESPDEHPGNLTGVTPPTRRGGSGRFLTDVVVELGFCDGERVQKAIEDARTAGMR